MLPTTICRTARDEMDHCLHRIRPTTAYLPPPICILAPIRFPTKLLLPLLLAHRLMHGGWLASVSSQQTLYGLLMLLAKHQL